MARLCLACAVLLAACLPAALAATDKTLKTVSGPCKDQFDVIMSEQYASDTDCPKAIKDAMSAAPADTSTCPGGGLADVGSRVQKCMSKDAATKDAWVSFIKGCEVMNVNERTGAGEAEAASTAQPSCFPRFNSLQAFKDYLDGKEAAAAKSGGAAAAPAAAAATLLAAAAAGAALLMW